MSEKLDLMRIVLMMCDRGTDTAAVTVTGPTGDAIEVELSILSFNGQQIQPPRGVYEDD